MRRAPARPTGAMRDVRLTEGERTVLHLPVIGNEARIKLTLHESTRIGCSVPALADLEPSGRSLTRELVALEGIQPLMDTLIDGGRLRGQRLTIAGRTLAEPLAGAGTCSKDPDIVLPLSHPLGVESRRAVPGGNVARERTVAKITGGEGETVTGRARVFEGEEGATEEILADRVCAGDVGVKRNQGPKGGPGMREMLSPSGALIGRGLVVHDALKRQVKGDPPASELPRRRATWKARGPAVRGVLAKVRSTGEQRREGSDNGRLRRCAVPVEATMDIAVLPDSVMGIGRVRQAVVSGQGSGYSSGPHLAMHMACASGSEPSGRRETVSVWGFEPYARQPRRLAARVLNVMNCRTANAAGQLGSGSDRLRASGKTATLHSFRFDPVFSDRSQRRFSNHI